MKDFKKDGANDVESFVKSRTGKQEKDVYAELYSRALEGKKKGTLSNEQIDAFCKQVSPMLSGEQRAKLFALASELKKI